MMTICGNPRAREGAIVFAGRDITTLPTHEIARLKIAQAPEGRRIFVRMTVLENLQMGAAISRAVAFRSRPGTGLRTVSAAEGAARPARRHAFGRRAADAGDRARADEPAAAAPARRAVARPRAADRPADFRRHPQAQRRGEAHGLPGRAERLPRAQARAPRLRHGQRPHHAQRQRPRASGTAGGEGGLSRRRRHY